MNSALPQDCNCSETSTNQGEVCTNSAYTTDEFFYNGPNSSCTELQNHDDITTAIQKLENFLCSVEVTQQVLTYIENNIEEFSDFITLVNDVLTCQTISNCFTPESICFTVNTECEAGSCPETFYVNPSVNINDRPSYSIDGVFDVFYNPALNRWESWADMALSSYLESNLFYPAGIWIAVTPEPYVSLSINATCPTTTTTSSSTSTSTSTTTTSSTSSSTTTTTTTAVPVCKSYTLQARITNAAWFGTLCENSEETGGVVVTIGDTTNTGCIFDNSLVLNGMSIEVEAECTTTTTSTSTSTSTTSTTSTTTTLYPCITKQLLILNNTASTVNNVESLDWLITAPAFVGPYSSSTGIQDGTNNAISVEIDPVIEPGCISLYVNTVLIQTIPFYYNDVFTFDPYVITKDDCVWIIINSEGC
jgi:hypothetical protein